MVQNTFLDENAAINILVAGGQSETLNGRGGKHNPPPSPPGRGARGVGAAACETSTHRGASGRLFLRAGAAGEDVNYGI